jgi:hypothetical protein
MRVTGAGWCACALGAFGAVCTPFGRVADRATTNGLIATVSPLRGRAVAKRLRSCWIKPPLWGTCPQGTEGGPAGSRGLLRSYGLLGVVPSVDDEAEPGGLVVVVLAVVVGARDQGRGLVDRCGPLERHSEGVSHRRLGYEPVIDAAASQRSWQQSVGSRVWTRTGAATERRSADTLVRSCGLRASDKRVTPQTGRGTRTGPERLSRAFTPKGVTPPSRERLPNLPANGARHARNLRDFRATPRARSRAYLCAVARPTPPGLRDQIMRAWRVCMREGERRVSLMVTA